MNKDALQQAIDNLSIQMIYLFSSESKITEEFDPLTSNQELIGQYGISIKSCHQKELNDENGVKHRFLVYKTEAGMRYLKGPISDELKNNPDNSDLLDKLAVAEISAVFVSEYLIKCEENLSEDAILEFGRLNVPHQIWSYWREFCHSMCARMSLPVSILPMYTVNKDS